VVDEEEETEVDNETQAGVSLLFPSHVGGGEEVSELVNIKQYFWMINPQHIYETKIRNFRIENKKVCCNKILD